MTPINKATCVLARSSRGNPVISTAVVILFYLMFAVLEASIETLLFGAARRHWFDPIFIGAFIAYAAFAVYWCAVVNTQDRIK